MSTEAELTALIEKYLSGQLNEAERTAFEKEINASNALKAKVEAQRKTVEAIRQNALRKSVKKGYQQKMLKNKLFKGGIALTIATLAVVSVLMVMKNRTRSNVLYELNEKGEKTWAIADKVLKPQVFEIDNTKDTVVETKEGMVLAIPAGAFKTKSGKVITEPVELEVKEAIEPATILSSGLSTFSNGKPLETGGMFYLSARVDGEPLAIDANKPINAHVPAAEKKPGMMLFNGERRTDGTINWIAPKELEKDLTPVDITSLNFYPPLYEDSVETFGYDRYNKEFTDSLYYSFASLFGKTRAIGFTASSDSIKREDGWDNFTDTSSKQIVRVPDAANGRKLFRANCASCHKFSQKLTGPALEGVYGRVPAAPTKEEWLKKFTKNNNEMIASGDPYSKELIRANGGTDGMGEFEFLSDAELDDLVAWVKNGTDVSPSREEKPFDINNISGINPAKIQSIWNKKFNNTLLATKEFEERLKVIHKTYNETVLDLYVNNLNKPLWHIDSMAAQMAGGEEQIKFRAFYLRHEGGVKINSSVQEKLSKYFEEKQRIYTEAATKTYKKFHEGDLKARNEFTESEIRHREDSAVAVIENYARELEVNMTEAYRQIGAKRGPAPTYYAVNVTGLGWKNLDQYVIESTTNRTTLDYTDPRTGKKAVIKYEPLTIELSNIENFDYVFAYLLADSIPSYMMMKEENRTFKEQLNELMKYDLVMVGLKGNDKYIYTEESVSRNTIKRVNLSQVSDSRFNSILRKLNRPSPTEQLMKEIEFRVKAKDETIRSKKADKINNLREKMIPAIFIENTRGIAHRAVLH